MAALLVFVALYVMSRENYLFFHCTAEIFSIIVGVAIFSFAWNSRAYFQDNYLLFLGIAYLYIGGLDLLHALAYEGMGVFAIHGADVATQLWLAGRYVESVSLVLTAFLLGHRLKPQWAFLGQTVVWGLLVTSIFYWHVFPHAFLAGTGLTPFKIASEYVICVLLAFSLLILWRKRSLMDAVVFKLLAASIMVMIASELCFTLYSSPFGFLNFLGHYLKIAAFYLVFQAIVQRGLRQPYSLLFQDLQRSQRDLEAERSRLEVRVAERTTELSRAVEALQREISDHQQTEQELLEYHHRLRSLASQLSLAEERERRRIAREIHDNLSQTLAFANMKLAALSRDDEAVDRPLSEIQELLKAAIADTRSLTFELSPPVLYQVGFKAALEWLCEHTETRHGIACSFENGADLPSLGEDIKTILFQAVRELFANMAKHARASHARISLHATGDTVQIRVEDDGVGFDPEQVRNTAHQTTGFGLFNVAERLEHLGGRLEIDSRPGTGARFTLIVPAPENKSGAA